MIQSVMCCPTDFEFLLHPISANNGFRKKTAKKNLLFLCASFAFIQKLKYTFKYIFAGEEAPVPEGGGVKPTFTERPVIRQSEEEANKIIFECRLVGEPRPEITWFHNDKQIVETERFKYSMELDATLYYLCRLEILNVDARDMGCYKAVARNASGEGHATINLTFEEGS